MNKNEFLKNVFRTIKKDNLEEFKKLTNNNKLINFKNKQKENLLFYSLQSGSINISQYIIESSPDLLLERKSLTMTKINENEINLSQGVAPNVVKMTVMESSSEN